MWPKDPLSHRYVSSSTSGRHGAILGVVASGWDGQSTDCGYVGSSDDASEAFGLNTSSESGFGQGLSGSPS